VLTDARRQRPPETISIVEFSRPCTTPPTTYLRTILKQNREKVNLSHGIYSAILSLRAFFCEAIPKFGAEIASSRKTLLAMTRGEQLRRTIV
jgi:hypothetical protein